MEAELGNHKHTHTTDYPLEEVKRTFVLKSNTQLPDFFDL